MITIRRENLEKRLAELYKIIIDPTDLKEEDDQSIREIEENKNYIH
jgi:hypothetical protein